MKKWFALEQMKQRLERVKVRKSRIPIERSRDLYVDFEFWKEGAVVPVVIQNIETSEVLSVMSLNLEALKRTLRSGKLFVCAGSGEVLPWAMLTRKGRVATHVLLQMKVDCHQTAFLAQVMIEEDARACRVRNKRDRTPRKTCFYRSVNFLKGELDIEK